ncbi:MAG: APC family permease [Alicyclobacillus sp.]|nr:APC family permease [Alicyclobacillus sp.]
MESVQVQRPMVFVRQATGLVRELSLMDAFILGFAQLNVMLGITEAFAWAPYVFPGANLGVAFLIATPLSLVFGLLYGFFSMAMPRSGGDYVWVSRTLSPPVGFAVNFFLTVLILSWGALNAELIPSMFLPPLLYAIGLKSWIAPLTTHAGTFLIGTLCVVVYTAIMCFGIRKIAKLMKWLFWIVLAGTVVWLLLLWTGSHVQFVDLLNKSWGVDYNQFLSQAEQLGFKNVSSGKNSLYAVIYAFQMFMGFQMVGYFSGEIKNASRNTVRAILFQWFVGAVLLLAISFGVYHYYGSEFMGAIAYIFGTSPKHYTLPLPGYLTSLALLLSSSPIVHVVMSLCFLSTIIWIIPTTWVYASRNIFAWSFDRIMPEKLSEVNEKLHSPVNVTILVGVLVEILLALTIYTNWWGYLVNLVGVMVICFFIVALAGVVFPYVRKDMFEKAPGIVQKKIFGIPLFTIVSALTALVMAYVGYISWTVPSISGGVTWSSLISSLMVFLIAFPIYYLAKWIQAHKGIDITLGYKEIPPE